MEQLRCVIPRNEIDGLSQQSSNMCLKNRNESGTSQNEQKKKWDKDNYK